MSARATQRRSAIGMDLLAGGAERISAVSVAGFRLADNPLVARVHTHFKHSSTASVSQVVEPTNPLI